MRSPAISRIAGSRSTRMRKCAMPRHSTSSPMALTPMPIVACSHSSPSAPGHEVGPVRPFGDARDDERRAATGRHGRIARRARPQGLRVRARPRRQRRRFRRAPREGRPLRRSRAAAEAHDVVVGRRRPRRRRADGRGRARVPGAVDRCRRAVRLLQHRAAAVRPLGIAGAARRRHRSVGVALDALAPMNPQLPEAVERDEEVQRTSRRRAFGLATDTSTLGIALSGGGIRSATLCLGAFQYFAREERRARAAGTARGRLLSRIDYCSSVTGGGYFATFFTSLFLPKHVRDSGSLATPEALPAETVDAAGPPPPTPWEAAAGRAADVLCDEGHASGRMTPLRWLRENGRYLAPNGGSDYLYAAATAIRNFLALHYVIAVSIVALFLLVGAARVLGFALAPDAWYAYVEAPFMPDPSAWLWPSAWWALAVASFALVLVPAGVAYFLAQGERWSETLRVNFPLITAIGVAAACIAFVASGVFAFTTRDTGVPIEVAFAGHGIDAWRCAAAFIAYVALAAIALYAAARLCGSRASAAQAPHAAGHVAANATEPAATTITRTKLSHWLLPPLYVTLAIAGYALVDTVGQTLYALYTAHALGRWAVGGGVLALLIALAKRLLPLVSGLGDSTTPWWKRIPATAIAFVAGIGLALVVAAVWSTMTHALAFGGAAPFGDPGCLMSMPADAPARDVALDTSGRIVV